MGDCILTKYFTMTGCDWEYWQLNFWRKEEMIACSLPEQAGDRKLDFENFEKSVGKCEMPKPPYKIVMENGTCNRRTMIVGEGGITSLSEG